MENSSENIVILIDDDPVVHAIVTAILSPRNFNVVGYRSAEEFFNSDPLNMESAPYIRSVMVDLYLADISGAEIMKRLNEQFSSRTFKICAISANTEDEAQAMMGGKHYDVFLHKPFSAEQILSSI